MDEILSTWSVRSRRTSCPSKRINWSCSFLPASYEEGRVSDDPTVAACWDSDRLDLGRVGIIPEARLLSTERAKRPTVIDWGWQRSRGKEVSLKEK